MRTDVATLNELIATRGAHLIHQRGSGYQLKIYNRGLFDALLAAQGQESPLPRTSRERVLHLQVLLLTAEQGSNSTSWRTPGISAGRLCKGT